jgi:hypothetical protein
MRMRDNWLMARYRLERTTGGYEPPPEWGEWDRWWVLDEAEGVPVGFVWEHHDLVAHNTWGPRTYVASHNPIDENGEGNPIWRAEGFESPQAALAALVSRIEASQEGP